MTDYYQKYLKYKKKYLELQGGAGNDDPKAGEVDPKVSTVKINTFRYLLINNDNILRQEYKINVKILEIDGNYNLKNIFNIIFNVDQLHLKNYTNSITVGVLPTTLKKLYLNNYTYAIGKDVLPNSLTEIHLNNYHKSIANDIWPPNLTFLSLNNYHYSIANGVLPSSLTKLSLDNYKCNEPIGVGVLPKSLEILLLNQYEKIISRGIFPISLIELYLNNCKQFIGRDVLPIKFKKLSPILVLFNRKSLDATFVNVSSSLTQNFRTSLNLGEKFP
jgi:hypothetical protein